MRAHRRRRRAVRDALAVQRERLRDGGEVPQRLQHAERPRLLVIGRLADVPHGRRGDPGLDQRGEQLLRRPLAERRLEQGDQLRPVADAVGVGHEARVGRDLVDPEHAAELAEELVVAGDDHQLAVARGEHLIRGDLRERTALAAGDLARAEVADELVGEQRERGLVQRHVDRPPGAGRVPLVQGGEHAERRPDAGAEVDQRDADAHRRHLVDARDAHDPGRRL